MTSCDFCDLEPKEDESLEPLYVGELPQPNRHQLSATRARGDNHHLLGRPIGVYAALHDALVSCPDVDVTLSESVMSVGDMSAKNATFTDRVNDEKVAARVTIRPKSINCTPDAKLCEMCADKFRN